MSYRVYFSLSSGLSKPVTVPKGTLKSIIERIQTTETDLGFETEQYRNNPKHWKNTEPREGVSDEVYCQAAEEHNRYVWWLYGLFERCFEIPTKDGEVITPEESTKFWHGLQIINVPHSRWTRDYFVNRMSTFYEVMRGREEEGIIFGASKLTEKQAAAVINIFSGILDTHDVRLDVPKGHDYLAAMDDGGYEWCEKCGAVTLDDAMGCDKKHCPIREEFEVGNDEE